MATLQLTKHFRLLKIISLTCALTCTISGAQAKVIGLFTWNSEENALTLVMPKLEEMTPKKVTEKYQKAVLENKSYLEQFKTNKNSLSKIFAAFKKGKVDPQFIPRTQNKEILNIITLVNRPSQIDPEHFNYVPLKSSFLEAGAELYTVPFGLETLLSASELDTYHHLLLDQFRVLLGTGGPDLDPALYHQKNTHSEGMNSIRDETELKLIRTFTHSSSGIYYGICRGHQAYAIAEGGELYQDVSLQGANPSTHATIYDSEGKATSSWHTIKLTDTKNALYEVTRQEKFPVNSRHHQSVKSLPEGRAIAHTDDQVIEAIEKRDDQGRVRVLTVQFHPELMQNETSAQLLKWMVHNAK